MITVQETIAANASGEFRKRWRIAGRYFRLLETLNPVTVRLGANGRLTQVMESVEGGAWFRSPEPFTYVEVEATSSEEVKFFISDGEAGYDRLYTAIAQARAADIADPSITVTSSPTIIVPAAARRKLVLLNTGALNGVAVKIAPTASGINESPIILQPGEMWVEETLASLRWAGIANSDEEIKVLEGLR